MTSGEARTGTVDNCEGKFTEYQGIQALKPVHAFRWQAEEPSFKVKTGPIGKQRLRRAFYRAANFTRRSGTTGVWQ